MTDTITVVDIDVDTSSLDAAARSAKKLEDQIEKAHGAAIEADRKRVASAERAAEKEAQAISRAHGAAIEADRTRIASAERAADREIAAVDRMHGQALDADRRITASAQRASRLQAEAAERASAREVAAIDRAHSQAIAADRARTASAVREAARQAAASERSSRSMASSFSSASKGIISSLAMIGASSVAAFAAIAINSAKAENEMQVLSAQAAMTSESFRALGFATEIYGVTAGKAADMSKDLFDRLGEFTGEGVGELKVLGVSLGIADDELHNLATTLSGMTGQDAFTEIVTRLDEAGVSGAEMVTVMEAIANDSSRLIPLYRDQAKELKLLISEYEDMSKAYNLTAIESQSISDLNKQFELLSKGAGLAATKITAAASPVLIKQFKSIGEEIEIATGWLTHFFKLMDDKSSESLIRDITDLEERLGELSAAQQGDGFKGWIYDKVAGDESKAAIDAEVESIKNQIDAKNELLRKNTQLSNQAEIDKANADKLLKPGSGKSSAAKAKADKKALDIAQKDSEKAIEKIKSDKEAALEKEYILQLNQEQRLVALMEGGTAKINEQHKIRLSDLQHQLDQGNLSYIQYLNEVAVENAETNAEIAADTAKIQEQLISDLTGMTSSLLGAVSREAEQAFNSINDLFKILSNFSWFNGSGGIFSTVGGWFGKSAGGGGGGSSDSGRAGGGGGGGGSGSGGGFGGYTINVHINGVTDKFAMQSAAETGVREAMRSISQDSVSRSAMPGGMHNRGLGL